MKAQAVFQLGALLLAAVLLGLVMGRWRAPTARGVSGCMAECPSAPAGCERTSIDPGACGDDACSKPAPVCHYAAAPEAGAGVVCPPTLAGRCIPPK